jgi:AmiR/NasT family two-component response regulator
VNDDELDALLRRADTAVDAELAAVVDVTAASEQLRRRNPAQRFPTTAPVDAGRKRVLIAEDEALIRLDLAEMLVEEGYDVVAEAGDGEAAVRLAEDLRPDLVILDIKMPIVDGLAAAERIAGEWIAPVVILTAFSQRDLVERARAAGAMACLVKPFQKSDLVPAIEIAPSRYSEIAALESEAAGRSERLGTRSSVDRAKGELMTKYQMTEPQAFERIQRTAVDHQMTMREVADRILAGEPATNEWGGAGPP